MLFLITILLVGFIIPITDTTKFKVNGRVMCMQIKENWCWKMKYYEKDSETRQLLRTVDYHCNTEAQAQENFEARFEVNEDEDPKVEIYSELYHNCTKDGANQTLGRMISSSLSLNLKKLQNINDIWDLRISPLHE